jgi:hypothetical protein
MRVFADGDILVNDDFVIATVANGDQPCDICKQSGKRGLNIPLMAFEVTVCHNCLSELVSRFAKPAKPESDPADG